MANMSFFFFFFGYVCTLCKFLDYGWDLSHSSDSTGYLTYWNKREFLCLTSWKLNMQYLLYAVKTWKVTKKILVQHWSVWGGTNQWSFLHLREWLCLKLKHSYITMSPPDRASFFSEGHCGPIKALGFPKCCISSLNPCQTVNHTIILVISNSNFFSPVAMSSIYVLHSWLQCQTAFTKQSDLLSLVPGNSDDCPGPYTSRLKGKVVYKWHSLQKLCLLFFTSFVKSCLQ